MTDILDLDFDTTPTAPPAGKTDRFGGRWRLVGAGLSNVWRYGDLDLPAASGRLLMRGPNGTGKTTALEALWPYLLDLNAAKLAAGKARPTSLKLLMTEGHQSKGRRYGYLWLTFAPPAGETPAAFVGMDGADDDGQALADVVSFGVRLQYSASSTPAVKVVPFTVPGRPLHEVTLRLAGGAALEHEEFCTRIDEAGGRVFDEPEDYIEQLAARIWSTSAAELRELASRLREVRNPSLLGDVSPAAAADALRQSLPGVASDVLTATAEALAESETTREAFERDEHAANVLNEFARVWTGHVVEVTRAAHTVAFEAATDVGVRTRDVDRYSGLLTKVEGEAEQAAVKVRQLDADQRAAAAEARAIEMSDAYRGHGRVTDLRERLKSERATAASLLEALDGAAEQARAQTQAGKDALDEVIVDLAELAGDAASAGAAPVAVEALLAHHHRARITRTVADTVIDPGPGLTLIHDGPGIEALEEAWTVAAQQHRSVADKAALIRRDHDAVATARHSAETAASKAEQAEANYDDARQAADRATGKARIAIREALAAVAAWVPAHPQLRGIRDDSVRAADGDGPTDQSVWDVDDVEALNAAEPATVLDTLSGWAEQTVRTGEAIAAAHENAAKGHIFAAADLETTAREHRAHASRLRAGQLLPLPRPDWAGVGDDDTALGSLLEWRSELEYDEDQRAMLEVALATAGVLGAHLETGCAVTGIWHISPVGAQLEHNLTAVLDVDSSHPYANIARAVLARIGLADTATSGRLDARALVIGRDGTFAAGPLAGHPAEALNRAGADIPPAGHVGARTRLARALARADELEALAKDLDARAENERMAAVTRRGARDIARKEANSFPKRDALTTAEAERVETAKTAQRLDAAARVLRDLADKASAEHAGLQTEWVTRARQLGVPTDLEQLRELITTARTRAEMLTSCAKRLTTRLLAKISRVSRSLLDEATLSVRFANLQQRAQSAHDTALATQALLVEAESVGDTDDAVTRFEAATGRAGQLTGELAPAREKATDAEKLVSTREAELGIARARLAEVQPLQMATEARLAAVLAWAPVADVLGVDAFVADRGTSTADGLGAGDDLLGAVDELLHRRPTAARKTLGDRYDEVRAELAQTWTIARAGPPAGLEELETFILTHSEAQYDPARASARAQHLAAKAKTALDSAEAAALRDFVIGRLPSAIGTAWTQLMDWKHAVNSKMRSAQASSGVGVQVQIALRDDLDPTSRTVYDLSCQVGDAVRTEPQKVAVGRALLSLLAAADGATMTERLASAVDIREWVEVHYVIERPGPGGVPVSRRWGSRTGLSGGERRLVVLAPMLAAIAANYDRLGETGLRLVPLDEVPAEVDEHGREGLARYIAELDLDLLCTSYLWDGAPGAWDGVDAHDLEAGADGTVVAFPMLVRGLAPLPGDSDRLAAYAPPGSPA